MSYTIERPPLHKNFWLPSRDELLKLKKDDVVKLIFSANSDVERMWVTILEQQSSNEWTGILDNDSYGKDLTHELKSGDKILFNPLDIIQIWED